MQAIIDRVSDEIQDLNLKLSKLNSMLEQPESLDMVGPYHFQLLMSQRHAMENYKKILNMRIDDLQEKL